MLPSRPFPVRRPPPPTGVRMSDITSQVPQPGPSEAITDAAPPPAPQPPEPSVARGVRLWPAVVLVALQWLAMKAPAWLDLGPMIQFQALFFAPMVAAACVTLWWLFFSRVRWADRLLVLAAGA